MNRMLSPSAEQLIEQYLSLPFPGRAISTPYFNNRRARVRGALRVLVGKGTPEDIVQEATIIALKKRIDLRALSNDQLCQFLVDHYLGADCSGLVYHILDAHVRDHHKKSLASFLHFPHATNFLRKILTRLRPAEHANVATFAHEKNSSPIALTDVRPGDLIVIQGAGSHHDRDHVLLVQETRKLGNNEISKFPNFLISYIHSFQWPADGRYNHGVRQGVIEITDAERPLIDQHWVERDKTGQDNDTWKHAAEARMLSVRRLNIL